MTAPLVFAETEADNDPAKALELDAAHAARIAKVRAVLNGSSAIRAGGTTYLPKLEGESNERYAIRAIMGAMHPAPDEMIDAVIGMLLQTAITFEPDMPADMIALWENIDGRGMGGMQYTRELLRMGICDGITGTFTDAPRADDPRLNRTRASAAALPGASLDAADGEAMGLRPYCVPVRVGDYYEHYEMIGGQSVLTLFIRRERVKQQVGKFGHRLVTQYRVYRREGNRVTCELWQEPRAGQRAEPVPNSEVVIEAADRICWSPLPCGPLVEGIRKSVIEVLCDLALLYYQVQNGMTSLSFEAFVATIVRVGAVPIREDLPDGTIKLTFPEVLTGPGEVIEVPSDPNAGAGPRVFYLQPNSDVLAPADQMLERIQGQIDMICNALYGMDTAGVESGEAKKAKARGGNAKISGLAHALKEHWELASQHLMMFRGKVAGGINVKTSFEDLSLSASDIAAIGGLVKIGLATSDAVQVLIDRGFFGPHADAEAIAQRWEDGIAAQRSLEADEAALRADQLAEAA